MKNKKIFLILIILLFSVSLIYYIYYDRDYNKEEYEVREKSVQELISIIENSDSSESLESMEMQNGAELIEYYHFSPDIYEEKKIKWREEENEGMQELEKPFNSIELNENSYFVSLKSKTNSDRRIIAIVDIEENELQVLIEHIIMRANITL